MSSWGKHYRCGQAAVTGIPECQTIHVNREKLENVILSCTRTMAAMVADEATKKKKELQQSSIIDDEIRILEAEKKRLSGKKLRIYEDYRLGRLTKEQYRKEYEATASRIQEIDERIPELKDKIVQMKERMSALTVRGLKRFVKEHKGNIEKGIELNPYGTNPKALFIYYLIFLCGVTKDQIHSFKDLETFVVKKFSGRSIKITGELCQELQKEIMTDEQYAKTIIRGAKVIEEMRFE